MEGKMALFLLLVAVLPSAFSSPWAAAVAARAVPAIYVFGDSTADVGNNNYLPGNQAKANFPHNGIDFPHGKPTGRFSNGYNGIDFLANKMGMRRSPPAYLSLQRDAQMFKGVNFASGGSGILDATGQNVSISMNKQIKYFEDIKQRLEARIGKVAADLFISKSLFVFSTGNNDMFGYYGGFGAQNNSTQRNQFIGLLASQFKGQLKTLYELGARKLAVIGASPIGCIPFLRRITPSGGCVEVLNEMSRQFNLATQVLLHDLVSTSVGMKYSFANNYEVVSTVMANPLKFGYKVVESACCGVGRFNAETPCTVNATYCSDRREYVFWDQFHPTQATYGLVADRVYNGGPNFATPVNFKQLAASS